MLLNHYNRLEQRLYPGGSTVYRWYHTAHSVRLFTVHFLWLIIFFADKYYVVLSQKNEREKERGNKTDGRAETIKRSFDYLTCSPVLLCPKRVQYVRLYMPAHICSSFTCSYFPVVAGWIPISSTKPVPLICVWRQRVVALLLRGEAECDCPTRIEASAIRPIVRRIFSG